MKSAVALFLVLALIAMDYAKAHPWDSLKAMDYAKAQPWDSFDEPAPSTRSITVNSLTSGVVQAVYRSPDKGRVTVNLLNNDGGILIHIDARFDWYTWKNTLVLNSKSADGQWGKEVHPEFFPFPCCGYITVITLRVEIADGAFVISANGIGIAKYEYQSGLSPPVDRIEWGFEDTGASLVARCESLGVEF